MFVTFTLTALAVLTVLAPAIMASIENNNVIKKQKNQQNNQNNENADENLETNNVLQPPVNLAAMLPITKLTSSGYTEDERLQRT
ncbi:7084_t:CDS:2 [Diversispora eburnea]|uniref:7084_t:CDS:1 n=1 Tax=Diversispora eburnea TaxID=1213867 RepID=A0A9N9A0V0_9GLOM|nr:7084_t:CDS:2 [Diversispora eburnea]